MNIEIMRNTLYKAYLEDFYKFCLVSSPNFRSGKFCLRVMEPVDGDGNNRCSHP